MPIASNQTKSAGFIHIPKCAGTSIEVALGISSKYPEIGNQPTKTEPDIPTLFGGGLQHLTIREILSHYNHFWEEIDFSFTVVRSPIDRFISHFLWKYYRFTKKPHSDEELSKQLISHTKEVENFAENNSLFHDPFEGLEYNEENPHSLHLNDVNRHIIPQCCFLYVKGGVPIDYIFSMDHLEYLEKLLIQNNVLQKPLEQRMKTLLKDQITPLVSEELIEKIRRIYRHDEDLYNEIISLSKNANKSYVVGKEISHIKNRSLAVHKEKHNSVCYESNKIPKKIWMLWLQGWDNAPELVRKCKTTWVENNPDWEINLLTKDTLSDFVSLPEIYSNHLKLTPAAFSDVLRIHLLAKFGGVWADATTWCAKPLDLWIERVTEDRGFFAYSKPGPDRPIASWFLAAQENNYIADKFQLAVDNLWHEFLRSGDDALDKIFSDNNDLNFITDGKKKAIYPHLIRLSRYIPKHFKFGLGYNYTTTRELTPDPKSKYYFWFHRTFDALLKHDPKFLNMWNSGIEISADAPHFLQHSGLLNPISNECQIHITNRVTNVYKLNRRINYTDQNLPGTVLDFLYKH